MAHDAEDKKPKEFHIKIDRVQYTVTHCIAATRLQA